jgi:hypothetical protein
MTLYKQLLEDLAAEQAALHARPVEVWINHPRPERRRRLADSRQLAAGSLTTRGPGSYFRPTLPTFTGEAAWRLRHEVSPVPG